MDNKLNGKVAVVTGGGRGIGAAVARRLAGGGAEVVLTYHNRSEGAAGVVGQIKDAGGRAVALRADSADARAITGVVDRAVAEYGRLDILVNNAGAFEIGPLEQLGVAEFDHTMAVNVRAPFIASKAAAAVMGEGARIITIGSNVAERVVFPGFSLYATSKAALIGLTKALARELGPRGITVNLVNPGPVNTELNPADSPNAQAIAGFTALGRYGEPEEIAEFVSYLACQGSYLTGAALAIDGGFNI